MAKNKQLKIFTWNVHGSYINALVKTGHNFFIPIKPGRPYNYDGKSLGYDWPGNVHEIQYERIKDFQYDVIIYQTPQHFLEEQYLALSEAQRSAHKIYIVHAPFKEDPKKYLNDNKKSGMMSTFKNKVLPKMNAIVHITKYNFKQWNSVFSEIENKSKIIYHGIETSNIKWTGELKKAVTVINDLPNREECGFSIFKQVSKKVPIDLFGNNSKKIGGKGNINNNKLKKELSKYRVYFNPTISSSVPMAMLEAMSMGLPVVSTATTEMPDIIKDGVNGFVSNDVETIIEKINLLLLDKERANKMGVEAKKTIEDKFSMKKFINEWNDLLYSL